MAVTYEIWIDDPKGRRVKTIKDYYRLSCTRVANGVGAITLTLPAKYDSYLKEDAIIEIWRKPEGGALKLFNAYFIRGWDYNEDIRGRTVTDVTGFDGNYLLDGRIIAYAAASAQSSKTDYADDMIKEIVSENLGGDATDTDRDLTASGFSIAGDESAGESITMGFSWRNVLETCQDIANASREAGTSVYFDTFPTFTTGGLITWAFRTTTAQLGLDRTGTDKLTISPNWGNVDSPSIEWDYSDEKTVIYAGGRGTEDDRTVTEVEDTTRATLSPWARREKFVNCAGQADTDAAVEAEGQAALISGRPKLRASGIVKDAPNCRLGIEWDFGYRVIYAYRGTELEVIITAVYLIVEGGGAETIRGRFEVVG